MMEPIFKNLWLLLLISFFPSCNENQENKVTYNKYLKRAISQTEQNYSGFKGKVSEDSTYYSYLKTRLLNDSIYTQQELVKRLESYLEFFKDDHLYLNKKQSNVSPYKKYKPIKNDSNKNALDFQFEILDSNTSYLKVPTFKPGFAYKTKSIIEKNMSQITTHDLLIIDIRGNGGGADRGWLPLMPLIYTNPINGINIEIFTSEENVIHTKQYRKSQELHNKMDSNPDSYVTLFGDEYIRKRFFNYKVLPKPKYVAVLVDRYVMSSGERFVLAAKQSMKTKIFGENTKGGIDYTNVRKVDIIDHKLQMSIPTTRTAGLPRNSIDGSGIVPDFYLNMSNTTINEIIEIYKRIL